MGTAVRRQVSGEWYGGVPLTRKGGALYGVRGRPYGSNRYLSANLCELWYNSRHEGKEKRVGLQIPARPIRQVRFPQLRSRDGNFVRCLPGRVEG